MAQVRKLQSGGITKLKRGNITLNGKVIASGDQITDEYLNNLVVGTGFEGVKNLLDEGGTWAIDDVNGYVETNFVPDLGNTRKANRRERKLGRATSEFAHRDVRDIKAGLEVVRQRIQPPKEQEKESKTHDLSKDIFLTIGEDGKILKDADYSNAKERVNFLKNINNLGIDFDNDILNYGQRSHTWDSIKKNSLLTNWNDDPDSWDESGKAMGEDYGIFIKKKDDPKKVDANDLNKDGIVDDDEKKISTEKPKYSAAGLDYDKHSPYIVFDDNGDMVLTNKFDTDFGVGNVAFNDFWRKSKSWNPDLEWLYGYSRYGNKLYKTSDIENKNSTLYKLLSNAGFFNMNLNDNYSEANNVFNYLWDSSDEWNRFNPETSYWDPGEGMSTKDLLYRPLTGVYKKEGDDDNYQILEYYYGNSDRDEWGRPVKYYYGLFNNDGKFIKNINRDELTRIDRGEQKAFSGIKNRIYDLSNNIYHGRIKNEYQGKDGSYVRTYSMPGEDIIIEMSDFDKYNHLGNNKKAFRLTPELSRIIEANPGFWDNLLKSVNREHFIASLRSMIDRNYIPGATYDLGLLPEDKSKYIAKEFGIKDDDIDSFLSELNSDIKYFPNISKQKMKYLVPLYNPIQKQQKGGLLGKTLADKEYEPVIVDNVRDINAPTSSDAGLSWDNLTSSDKLQLVAVAADLMSMLGGFKGAALGLSGTGLQFASDIKRDGLDFGDLKELGLGVGLDIMSIMPGFGSAKVFKALKNISPIVKGLFIGLGAKDGIQGLNNIMSGDYSVEDFRKVANGLLAVKSASMKRGEIKASKEKSLPEKQKVNPKTADDFRREYIDDFVKNNPNSTYHNGSDVEWFDRSTGKVIDYNKANEGLKNIPEYKPKEGIESIKAKYDKLSSSIKNTKEGIAKGRYNPFGENFKYKSSRRTLGSTTEEVIEAYKANPNAVARLANVDDNIADELANAGFNVARTWYGRAIISKPRSHKNGGAIKKYSPGGFIKKVTTKEFELPDFTKQAIDLSRHVNAYTQRKKEAELTKKMYDKVRYNNELVNYDKISSVAGISPIMQRENAENQILKSTYSNIAKTTDFGKQLSIANTIADKQLANSRLRNIDLGTQLNKNELTLIGQNNEEKVKNVALINDDRRRLASIESGKIQADIGLTSGNASQFEAGATQFLSDLNKHKLLTSKSNAINDEYEANKWYSDEYNKIISERLAAIKDSGLSQEQFYLSPQAQQYSDRLNNLLNLYKSKLKSIEINNTFDPYTGKYLSSNLPQYVKKGGRVRSDKEFNNDRILKNIELDNKRIIQLNENILKLLMKALG